MQVFRRHLALIACGWLSCQLVGIATAPVMLWRVSVDHPEEACDCPIAPGAACPMHKGDKHDDPSTCKMRNAFPTPDQALFGQIDGAGLLPLASVAVITFDPGEAVRNGTPSAILRAYRPDSPPPRA